MAQRPAHVHAIVGPTGIGKTRVAESMAKTFGVPILVADRIQCFEDFEVTSARIPGRPEHGVPRLYAARRLVRDGDLPARETMNGLISQWERVSTVAGIVVLEGGSISLIRALLTAERLPFSFSADVRRVTDHRAYRAGLVDRARDMLHPTEPGGNRLRLRRGTSGRSLSFAPSSSTYCEAQACETRDEYSAVQAFVARMKR